MCRFGTVQFEVIPLGLMNSLSTSQRLMDDIFKYLAFVLAYLDYVSIFSSTLEDHVKNLKYVLGKIQSHGLKIKLKNCDFGIREVSLLRHIVYRNSIWMDPDKI